MDECLNSDQIDKYVHRELSKVELGRIEKHLRRCQRCQKRVWMAQPTAEGRSPSACGDAGGREPGGAPNGNRIAAAGAGIGHMPHVSEEQEGDPAPNPASESMFENYRVLKELPQGGQASVYKALHIPTKMTIALKILPPGQHVSRKARWHFEREVELAASLNHPNIVAIRDSGIARGQYYFSMEYIRGEPLDQYLASRSLSLREKMALFAIICEAMTHAHQRGVIHRDLKPSNILVDERGQPHILDFGLAKSAGSRAGLSQDTLLVSVTGQIKGTLAYMSPEQAAGQADQIDVRTDVYSLGLVLYQMTVGRFPYDVSGPTVNVLDAIQRTEPARPRRLATRFDSDVEAIILKALAKDRRFRYQSAAELLHDVQCWLDGRPIVARSASSIYLLRKLAARHRYTATVVTLLLLIVVGFSYVCLYLAVSETRARNEAQALAEDFAELTYTYRETTRFLGFLQFLEAWHQGRKALVDTAGHVLLAEGDSRERRAVDFLGDNRPMSEKEADFRNSLETRDRAFAEFVIGEYHLRDGRPEKALVAYDNASEAMKETTPEKATHAQMWLSMSIKRRRGELGSMESRSKRSTTSPGGDLP